MILRKTINYTRWSSKTWQFTLDISNKNSTISMRFAQFKMEVIST